ncbi:MAG: asparagine synthase (glutamine-hydrolyzing) [Planctomycetota bacterium]
MCGIAGIARIGGAPIASEAIVRMCDTLAHRGPDDAGYAFFERGHGPAGRGSTWLAFADARFRHLNEHLPVFGSDYACGELERTAVSLALGHRRLSILDLSHRGHQPMCSADQRFWLVHNGEIYNFPELRVGLEQKGYSFRSTNDTEVIVRLWEEYGADCLPMLDGMFAFAIYDRLENRLTIARDRFGVKPLYYALVGDTLLFASEIKALFASGMLPAAIEANHLREYLTFQNLFGDHTLWQGVRLLEPGESITVAPGEHSPPRSNRWFRRFPHEDRALDGRADEIHEQLRASFEGAVRRQLVSDVKVGSYLSGGMDSGSIVAVAGRAIPRMHTFTAGFDLTNVNGIEQGFDERRQAEMLSYLLQTEHYAVVLHAGDMPAAMDRITWHMDDPRVGMCHQNWYVAKLASRFVKVCLAGTGGDELFAGYPWRYRLALNGRLEDFAESYFDSWHRLLPARELGDLFSRDLDGTEGAARASFDSVLSRLPDDDPELPTREALLRRTLEFEFRTFLNGLLVTEDRISMAHSMESRVPFMDNALADFAWRIPSRHKLHLESLSAAQSAYIDSTDGKLCLRRAMQGLLPDEFLFQQKRGFSPPDENWYRGPSMAYIQEILLDPITRQRPWFDQEFVKTKLDEHFQGRRNHRLLVWSLLSVEWIQRHFVDGQPPAQETPPRDQRR